MHQAVYSREGRDSQTVGEMDKIISIILTTDVEWKNIAVIQTYTYCYELYGNYYIA